MGLSLIVAYDKDRGIGKDGTIPWNIPEDLKWFRERTMGAAVVMGSRTYYSIPENKRPLDGRKNYVLTRKEAFPESGVTFLHSVKDVIDISKHEDVYVAGGGSLYKQLIGYCDTLYITEIQWSFQCDTFFPKINEPDYVELLTTKEANASVPYSFRILSVRNHVGMVLRKRGANPLFFLTTDLIRVKEKSLSVLFGIDNFIDKVINNLSDNRSVYVYDVHEQEDLIRAVIIDDVNINKDRAAKLKQIHKHFENSTNNRR